MKRQPKDRTLADMRNFKVRKIALFWIQSHPKPPPDPSSYVLSYPFFPSILIIMRCELQRRKTDLNLDEGLGRVFNVVSALQEQYYYIYLQTNQANRFRKLACVEAHRKPGVIRSSDLTRSCEYRRVQFRRVESLTRRVYQGKV